MFFLRRDGQGERRKARSPPSQLIDYLENLDILENLENPENPENPETQETAPKRIPLFHNPRKNQSKYKIYSFLSF